MTLDLAQDLVLKSYENDLEQFRDKPRYKALMESYSAQAEELQVVFLQLSIVRAIDLISGYTLRQLGALVGELYSGQSTADYRLAIKARIFINNQNSTAEDILHLFDDHHMIDRKSRFSLRSIASQTEAQAAAANTVLQRVKGAGLGADYQYNNYGGAIHFQMDSVIFGRGTFFYRYHENKWLDGDCELVGTDNWLATSGSIAKDSTTVHTAGGSSLCMTPTNETSLIYNLNLLEVGIRYFYSFWIYVSENCTSINVRDNTITIFETSITLDTWVKVKGYYIAQNTLLKIGAVFSDDTDQEYFIDDCEVIECPVSY